MSAQDGTLIDQAATTQTIDVRREQQETDVGERVSAVLAVVRPVLEGVLYGLRRDRADRLGGYEAVTLQDLAREYRASDGDYGVSFEYAVHDAIRRGDPLVMNRVDDVLATYCKIRQGQPNSILFGVEKDGAQRLIATAKELLTPNSVLMTGSRGRPVQLRRHIDAIAREFRKRQPGAGSELPFSISGVWKADMFVGSASEDRWVATTVKVKERALEGAPGLRLGVVPVTDRGTSDRPWLDERRNLVVLPLPYDGEFSEVFFSAWAVVQQFLNADARVPRPVALPNSADREVARQLEDRRSFPVVDVIEALIPIAQPQLLVTEIQQASVEPTGSPETIGARTEIDTEGLLAPIAKNTN